MKENSVFLLFVASLLIPTSLYGQDKLQKNPRTLDERPQQIRRGEGGPDIVAVPGRSKGPVDQVRSRGMFSKQTAVAPGTRKQNGIVPGTPSSESRIQLEELVTKLNAMEVHGGGDAAEDDWFVVGGSIGNDVNFDAFQGERDVAQKVVDFVESTNDEGQWRIFYRVQDSEQAQKLVTKVERNYGNWRRQQAQNALASQRRQNTQRNTRRSGGFRTSGVGRSGSC